MRWGKGRGGPPTEVGSTACCRLSARERLGLALRAWVDDDRFFHHLKSAALSRNRSLFCSFASQRVVTRAGDAGE